MNVQKKNKQQNNADLFISFVKCCCVEYELRKSYHIYNGFCLYSKTLARLFIFLKLRNKNTTDKTQITLC